MLGFDRPNLCEEYPLIAQLYDEFCLCRELQLIVFRRPEEGNKESLIQVPWTSGIKHFPRDGGSQEQSFIHSKLYHAFMRGERNAQQWLMKK